MTATPLRAAREAAGISLSRMAAIIDEDKGNLSKVENMVGNITTRHLRDVAMLYDIALGNEPYTLVRECQVLPANLTPGSSAIPGLLGRLTLTPSQAPNRRSRLTLAVA